MATPLPTPRDAPVTSALGIQEEDEATEAQRHGELSSKRASLWSLCLGGFEGLHSGDFRIAHEAELAADAIFDRLRDVRVFLQELLRVFAALAQTLAAVGEPRAGLFNDSLVDADVDEVAHLRDAFAVHHVAL